MKIAVNTRFLQKGKLEGIGVHTYEICKRMVLQNPKVEFHFFFDRAYDEEFRFGDNVIMHVLYPPARHPILWYCWFEIAVCRRLRQIRADVFFSPDMYMSLRSTVPTLISSHDLAYIHYPDHLRRSHLWYFRKYFSAFHKKAARIACVSETTKQDVIAQYNISPEKIFVANNAAGKQFAPLTDKKITCFRREHTGGLPYFLFLGAIHPRKNVEGIIAAYNQYRDAENLPYPLIVAGRLAWKFKKWLISYNNSPYKKDILRINDPDDILVELVGSAFAMVYVSYFEGFGLPIIEAMQSGVPVIASNMGAMKEIATDAAYLVDPTDESGIALAMGKLVTDSALKDDLVIRGVKRARYFNWDTSSRLIFKHLSEIAKPFDTNK